MVIWPAIGIARQADLESCQLGVVRNPPVALAENADEKRRECSAALDFQKADVDRETCFRELVADSPAQIGNVLHARTGILHSIRSRLFCLKRACKYAALLVSAYYVVNYVSMGLRVLRGRGVERPSGWFAWACGASVLLPTLARRQRQGSEREARVGAGLQRGSCPADDPTLAREFECTGNVLNPGPTRAGGPDCAHGPLSRSCPAFLRAWATFFRVQDGSVAKMKRPSRCMMLAALAWAVAPLAGCASLGCGSSGLQSHACTPGPMRVGSTTKAQVVDALGSPRDVRFDRGQEEWVYTLRGTPRRLLDFAPVASMVGPQARDARGSLVIRFDPRGIVQGYVFTEGRTLVRCDRLA